MSRNKYYLCTELITLLSRAVFFSEAYPFIILQWRQIGPVDGLSNGQIR